MTHEHKEGGNPVKRKNYSYGKYCVRSLFIRAKTYALLCVFLKSLRINSVRSPHSHKHTTERVQTDKTQDPLSITANTYWSRSAGYVEWDSGPSTALKLHFTSSHREERNGELFHFKIVSVTVKINLQKFWKSTKGIFYLLIHAVIKAITVITTVGKSLKSIHLIRVFLKPNSQKPCVWRAVLCLTVYIRICHIKKEKK